MWHLVILPSCIHSILVLGTNIVKAQDWQASTWMSSTIISISLSTALFIVWICLNPHYRLHWLPRTTIWCSILASVLLEMPYISASETSSKNKVGRKNLSRVRVLRTKASFRWLGASFVVRSNNIDHFGAQHEHWQHCPTTFYRWLVEHTLLQQPWNSHHARC